MDMKERTDQEVDNILNSVDTIQRGMLPHDLYQQILRKARSKTERAPAKLIWLAAASFALLLALNWQAIRMNKHKQSKGATTSTLMYSDYQIYQQSTVHY